MSSHYDRFDLGQDSAYCDRISDPPEDDVCPECDREPCQCGDDERDDNWPPREPDPEEEPSHE